MDELLSVRVGFDIVRGAGWCRPVVMRADWPLGKLVLTRDGIRMSVPFLGGNEIAWECVTLVQKTWMGFQIQYTSAGEPHELEVHSPFLWKKLRDVMEANSIIVPAWAAVDE